MSSAPTQIAVAPSSAGNLVTSSSGQIQKDYLEEPLARQNSLGNRGRGGLKGKALTRSHAMREAASPPRTPTPRSDQLSGLSPITSGNHPPSSPEINDSNTSKMHVQSVSSVTQTTMETPSVIITTQQQQSQQQQQQIQQNQNHSNVVIYSSNDNNTNSGNVICNDVDFPKLTPPKSSKGARNRDNGNNNSNNSHNNSNNVNNNGNGAGGGANNGGGGCGNNGGNNICNNIGMDNNNKQNNNEHKIHQQQQQLQQSISSGDSTNYINGKKVVNDSSNSKSPNNHNNNNNINSNGQNNNNSSINSINNNNDNSNIQINSSSTNCSNRNNNNNSNLNNNDSYINNNNNNNSNNNNNNNNSINVSVSQLNPQASPYINNSPISPPVTALSYDKDNRCPRNESQNSNNSGNYSQEDSQNCVESPSEKSDRLSKKHRNGANSKGTKPRLKNMSGSSSSMEGGNSTSGFISRDSSTEQFTDQSGIDLVQFFKETLNKSPKDRSTLMEIEKDLIELAHDKSQKELRFQPMSSYNRMLIHRVAAFFGMEHNVDKATQQCVIVAPTKATRIPDIRFKQLVRDEPRKSILKRDTHSFDDSRQGGYLGVDRGVLDRKAKSFEEREEEYQKARRRIFRGRESIEMAEEQYWGWSNSDNGSNGGSNCGPSPSNSGGGGNGGGNGGSNNNNNNNESSRIRQNNKLLKPMERQDSRQNVSKSHNNFGGYGGGPSSNVPSQQQQQNMQPLSRNDSLNSNKSSGQRAFSKQDSVGSSNAQSWRLSPSSSGSVYHYDPSNLPPNQSVAPGMYNNNPNNTHRKNKMERQKKSSSSEQHNNCNNNNNNNHNTNTPSPGLSHNINSTTPTPIDNGNGNILMNSNSNSTSTDTNTISTTSIDNISEMSGQTVVNINPNNNSNNNNNNNGNIIQNNIDIDENDDDLEDSSTKENQIMINREMDDIEEEIVTNYDECEKSTLKVDDELRNLQEKPKFINQATSPNIPSPEPEYNLTTTVIIPSNEVGKPNIKSSTSDNQTPISISNVSTRSTPSTTLTDNKKDETKTISSNIPIMSYATGYQTLDGTTVFQPAGTGPYTTTTYQQGPDGSVYAVPQQMVYTYPQPLDGSEIQGYFVYDQTAAARDGTTLVPTPVYQPSSGATVVPVAAYPSNPFGSAPIYQQQVVYTPEQFPNTVAAPTATAAGQVQQYPVTYPVGYSYPYNGYWGQAMTYYVPQPPLANAVSSSIIPPPPLPIVTAGTASAAQAVNIGSSINPPNNNNSSHSGTVSGKRNTPPQQTQQHSHHHHHSHSNQQQQQQQQHHHHHHHQQQQSHHQSHHTQTQSQQQQQQAQQHQQHQQNLSGQSSQSATPANATYQFATTTSAGVPVALTSDPNGPTMYAIPQSAVFPNAMLPYGHPPQAQLVPTTQATQATPAGVITHLPHQSQTVISPMIAQPAGAGPPGSILPPQHISIDQTGAISIQQQPHTNTITHSISTNGNNAVTGNHGNRSCTPQSTPSTPVSTTLPTINHHHHPPHRNNPPLFATPPMIPNGFNSQIANNPYQQPHYTETHQHHHSSQQQHQFNQQQSHSGATNSVSSSSYEKKNSYSNIKKNSGSNNNHNNNHNNNNNNNGGVGGYNSNNSGNRQNAYSSNINNNNQRKMHENTNSSVNNFSNNNSSSTNNSNNNRQMYNTGQSNNNKRINNIDKTQSSTTIGNAGASNTVGVQNISSTNLNSSATAASITSNNNNSAQLNSDIKPRPGGIRQKPGNLDFKRNGSQRNSPSTNSAESNNNSPNSIASSHNNNHNNNNLNSNAGGGIPTTPVIMTAVTATAAPAEHHQPHPQTHQHQPQHQHQQTMYMTRGTHIPPMHTPTAAAIAAATAAVVSDAAAAAAATHQPLIGAYNHHQVAPGGMYFKYGQTYFAHPSVATLPNNRRSPPNEIRPSLTPIYSTVNMMLPAPRQIQPRHPNPNYKGNKPSR